MNSNENNKQPQKMTTAFGAPVANDDDIKEQSRVFFNHELFRNVDDLWEKKNSQRQFYTLPNTQIPNNRESFMKWLYTQPKNSICKQNTGACDRYGDLRQLR